MCFFAFAECDHFCYPLAFLSCWSYFGKIGGRQAVGLVKNGCMDKGAIQHEMNHALGFIHEQARSDRDKFVKIMWEHITAGKPAQC